MFGKLFKKTGPGLNYNLPSPIGTVFRPKVTIVNQVQVGFRTASARSGGAIRAVPEESLMLTGDENIIDVRSVPFWVIKDAEKFLVVSQLKSTEIFINFPHLLHGKFLTV